MEGGRQKDGMVLERGKGNELERETQGPILEGCLWVCRPSVCMMSMLSVESADTCQFSNVLLCTCMEGHQGRWCLQLQLLGPHFWVDLASKGIRSAFPTDLTMSACNPTNPEETFTQRWL